MPKILVIDDDPIYQKMLTHALQPVGYEVLLADDGLKGLAIAGTREPDLIICDVMMPNLDGYETVRRFRANPRFIHLPIMMLTAQSELEEKLVGFEVGVDDYMTKPFAPPELLARVSTLLRRGELLRKVPETNGTRKGCLIAFHSLRGGTGCSTLAVNTAVALMGLWERPVCVLDLVLTAGQVALMLNGSLKRTWADLGNQAPADINPDQLAEMAGKHDSGLAYFAAPTLPPKDGTLTSAHFERALDLLETRYDYLVADLSHDTAGITRAVLKRADQVVLVCSPEMASLRAAAVALDAYKRMEFPPTKALLVLNWTFERRGLARKSIETTLHQAVEAVFPFAPDVAMEALNYSQPFVHAKPGENLSAAVEDFAFLLSREEDRCIPPADPSKAWLRVSLRARASN